MTKRVALQAKKADLEKAVRELGTLPADAFEKYRDQSMAQLHKLLGKAQGQMKKFGCALFHLHAADAALCHACVLVLQSSHQMPNA